MPQPTVTALPIPEFNLLATGAGFLRVEAAPGGESTTPEYEQWRSAFAILALVRVSEASSRPLDTSFTQSTEWISALLKSEENQGRLIDGYLLLAIPSKPDAALLAQVRRIESDTSVCRKHVLWPEENHSWLPTLYAVTTLGLPSSSKIVGEVKLPELPWAASRALDARDSGTSIDDVAALMEDLAEDESEKE